MAALVSLAAAGGCGIAIQEGAGKALGPAGAVVPIQPPTLSIAQPLREYSRFEVGEFANEIGLQLPADLLPQFRADLPAMLAKYKVAGGPGGKTLLIRGRVLHYEGSGAVGVVTSPVEEVVVRTELVDKASGRVLATANCVGRSTTRLNRGVDKKAAGLAKAVAKWIAKLQQVQDLTED